MPCRCPPFRVQTPPTSWSATAIRAVQESDKHLSLRRNVSAGRTGSPQLSKPATVNHADLLITWAVSVGLTRRPVGRFPVPGTTIGMLAARLLTFTSMIILVPLGIRMRDTSDY